MIFTASVREVPSRPSLRRLGRRVLVVAVALGAAGVAMNAWGATRQDVGPLETRLALVPSLSGGVAVDLPPLGRLALPTHAGPLQLKATVTGIDQSRAQALLRAKNPGQAVTDQVTADSERALATAATRALLVALGAAGVTCAVVFRRRQAVLGGTAAVAGALLISAAVAGTTLRTEAINEPTFDGLLVNAPGLIGSVEDFGAYSERVAQLTSNVARVYGSLSSLPAAPEEDSVRMLWVSDIHLNPGAFAVMRELVEQFEVVGIIDTGDIVDLGSDAENRLIGSVGTFDVPYLWVRGNHDSTLTQAYIDKQRGARVLDDGDVIELAGVRFAGIGDPLFTPNKRVKTESEANDQKLLAAGEELAEAIEAESEPVDVALVHEPKMAEPLFGKVPLILDGHLHERRHRVADGTLELTQGSTGGAGLRTLDKDEALPLQMSILHFDDEGTLLAVDDVTVGGLGQRSVTVERRTPSSYGEVAGPQE